MHVETYAFTFVGLGSRGQEDRTVDSNTSSHLRRRQAALAARSARHGVVTATTPTDALSVTTTPSYLAPKRQRRGYGDRGVLATSARSSQHDVGEPAAVGDDEQA
jgi:hypothetical protein